MIYSSYMYTHLLHAAHLVELCFSRTGIVLEQISDTGLERVASGSTQLEDDVKRSLEALRWPLVHHVGFEGQLESWGYGRSVPAEGLDARVVVLRMTVLTGRPIACHYADWCPPLDHRKTCTHEKQWFSSTFTVSLSKLEHRYSLTIYHINPTPQRKLEILSDMHHKQS